MILYDPTTREVTLNNGETIEVPRWVADATHESEDPSRLIRLWLRSRGIIGPDEEVGYIDVAVAEPVSAEVDVVDIEVDGGIDIAIGAPV